MSLVDDVTGALPFLREQAEALMVDECKIHRPGDRQLDENTGQFADTSDPVYEGVCKFQATLAAGKSPLAGSYEFTVQELRLDLPVSAGPVAVDDVVTVTASVFDAQLVGRVYRVVELFHKSFATAQRCRVEEVNG
jgi:hypothetical protein